MKRLFGMSCLVLTGALVLAGFQINNASAQQIFVPRNSGGESSSEGEKRKLYIPNNTSRVRPSPGGERRGFKVFEPSNETGFQRSQAEREADRRDAIDEVQRMNIDMATRQSEKNMQIIARQRAQRQLERENFRRSYAEQKEAEMAQENTQENLPPEMRTNQPSVEVGGRRVLINQNNDPTKLDRPQRIFNTFQ